MKRAFALVLVTATALAQQQAPPANEKPADKAWRIIGALETDSNADKRRLLAAAASLGPTNARNYALLGGMLLDKDEQVRSTACESLDSFEDKRTASALRPALDDSVPEVAFCAAQALWHIEDPEGRDILVSILEGEQATTSKYLAKQKRSALRLLTSPQKLFASGLEMGIGFIPLPGVDMGISSLRDLMKDESQSGRGIAAIALANDKDPRTLDALRAALSDKSSGVRAAAVHALALRGDHDTAKDVLPLMDDEKDAVRVRAAFAYLRLIEAKPMKKARPKPRKKLPIPGPAAPKIKP